MSAAGKYASADHRAAARMLGYALVSDGDPDLWFSASVVWSLRLRRSERAALAWAALRALHFEDVEPTLLAAMGGAGMPIAPFVDHADEAAFWADMASAEELEACCLAAFRKMSRGRQVAFVECVQRRAAA